jgi:hypothetical protein
VQLEVRDLDAVRVDCTHDVGEPEAVAQAHCNVAGRRQRLAELREELGDLRSILLRARDRMHARATDLGLQLGRRSLGDDLALVDDPDPVREDVGLLEVLRRQEDRHTGLAAHQSHLVPDVRAALRIEARRRLVEEEDARAVDEGEREVEPSLHPARVPRDLAIGRIDEADAVQQLLGARLPLRLRDALQRRLQAQVVAGGEERVESRFLERDADEPADLRPVLDDVVARDERSPRGRREQRGQDVDRGGLPGAVRPEEAVDLSWVDREVDAVDRAGPLPVLANEPTHLDPVLRHHSAHPTHGGSYNGSSGSFAATTGLPLRRYATSTESFCRYVPAIPTQSESQRQKPSLPSVLSSRSKTSVRPSIR